jgi:hypothetical protein
MQRDRTFRLAAFVVTVLAVCSVVYTPAHDLVELENRIPETAPYDISEAQLFPPPYEEFWKGSANPGQCQSCHRRIYDDWAGSMMANAWRDPAWRGAFLLAARQMSTDGDCAAPAPPDGTAKARLNPFASSDECASLFDIGGTSDRLLRPGSLVDGFCSRCHMPSNYVDNVPLHAVVADRPSGLPHARLAANFNPTSDAGTGIAFATYERQFRNTESGKAGVSCAICHSIGATRDTPYHTLARAEPSHPAMPLAKPVSAPGPHDVFDVPDARAPNLGYAVGSGSFRLSPYAIGLPNRLGPLPATLARASDGYLEGVFRKPMPFERVDLAKHAGRHDVLLTRSELCAGCHDVTNPLTIANRFGKWVGTFPIERTYTEWLGSRYADRPGNRNFDPNFKRDCQTCHMQQDYGQPGTAQSLYLHGEPREPLRGAVADQGAERRYFSHHFVGGNTYIPRVIGSSLDTAGAPAPYPKLSIFSFTSADPRSPYHNAFWTGTEQRGATVQQARLAWDRLRNVLDLEITGPRRAARGSRAPLVVRVTNSGSGHKFPTGFPEGRVAWLAVRAFDVGSGRELELHDSHWKRTARGLGQLTRASMRDPNVPNCNWTIPAGSPDPYAVQFKAIATLGDGCPTLDLTYSHAGNLVVNEAGQPIDRQGKVIDRTHPRGIPQFVDRDGDGDLYDDSFLSDTRLDPLPHGGATRSLDRYSVLVPGDVVGPVAVTAAVYYQSLEAVAAIKLLGNLADTDLDFRLEPCVLGGLCDGRIPDVEPAVVEGSPPVPMEVRSWLIEVGEESRVADLITETYPAADATNVPRDAVVKAFTSQPVAGLDARTFTLRDGRGVAVPASVDQIGDGTWALFPHSVFLAAGETYTARIESRLCTLAARCAATTRTWKFTAAPASQAGQGDTRVPSGFR